jgi:thiol-disulfide isomerase/thioredoxin
MNKIILLTFLYLFCLSSLSAQDKITILYGKAENSKADTLTLSNHYGKYVTMTDQYGKYRFELKIKDPDFLNFDIKPNHATLFLLPGDTLEMNFDNNNFEKTLFFNGQKARINSNLLLVSRGKLAPGFSFKDFKGSTVTLNDFKGKYIYIDVWNSACGPCFKEFPFMAKLVEKYKNNNIVFIGIPLDSNEHTWKNTIIKRNLKGIQLFGNGWNSEFADKYFIKFNPRFILIDKNQRILYLSAPRPSGDIDIVFSQLDGF